MIDLNNWIYHNTENNKARFAIGERGEKTLVCFGINPSTATPEKLDNTLETVKRFSQDLGYDSWIMLNIYPQRATDPNDLDIEILEEYHKENLKYIEQILKSKNYDIRAARGTLIEKRSYLLNCLTDIFAISKKYSTNRYSIGKISKKGHPHHPLYLSKKLTLDEFNIINYLNSRK